MEPISSAESPAAPLEALLEDREWVRSLARSLTPDRHRAEEIEQRTWLAALRSPPSDPAASRSWLARVTRNLARDLWRSDIRRAAREQAVARRGEAPAAMELAARAEVHRRLMRAVLALDEPYQGTVLLRFFDGLAPAEIARRSGVPAATVRTRLHRALIELRRRLERDGTHRSAIWLLAAPPAGSSGITSGSLGTAGSVPCTGGLLVAAKHNAVVIGLVLAALVGGGWWVGGGLPGSANDRAADPSAPNAASADAAGPTDGADARERRARERKAASAAGRAGDEAETTAENAGGEGVEENPGVAPTSAAAAAVRPGPQTIQLEFRGFVEPVPVPPGVTEIDSFDDIPEVGPGSPQILPYWSRWPMRPRTGSVAISGRVVDAAGDPLEDAVVYRIDITKYADPGEMLSFQYINEIARTDAEGRFRATGVRAGELLLAADFQRLRIGARGLRVDGGHRANPSENEHLEGVELKLPVESGRLGKLEGSVRDWEGRLAESARVRVGSMEQRTGRDGRFRFSAVEPGPRTVRIESTGSQVHEVEVDVSAGETARVDAELELNDAGRLHFRGRVLDPAGEPVADARVFLGTNRRDTQRYGRTDAEGRFRFDGLPDALAEATVSFSLLTDPDTSGIRSRTVQDLRVPDDDLELVVDRAYPVTLRYVSKLSGERIARGKYEVTPETPGEPAGRAPAGGGGTYAENGEQRLNLAPGRYLLTARAEGHRGMQVAFELVPGPRPTLIVLEFEAE